MNNAALYIVRRDTKIIVGPHAVSRYQQRVRPTLSMNQCHGELRQVLDGGHIVRERPSWVTTVRTDDEGRHWLRLGDDVAFPLQDQSDDSEYEQQFFTLTCITRGSELDDHGVARRRARRAKRKARRQDHERKAIGDGKDPKTRLAGRPRKD